MNIHWKDWCWSWNSNTLATWCKELTNQFSSDDQSCLTIWNPMAAACQASLSITNSQSLLKLVSMNQWCHTTISSSVIPFSSCPQSFPASWSFLMSWLFTSGGQNIGASASASVLPKNTQNWFPLGLTDLIYLKSKGLSRVFSNTTVQKHQFLSFILIYGPTLTSIWKNHSFDCMNLCWQSNVSAF